MPGSLKSQLILQGKSGRNYHFDLLPMEEARTNQSGVYIISNRHPLGNQFNHSIVYIGVARSFSAEMENHPLQNKFDELGANYFCVLLHLSETDRKSIQEDLLASNKTPCN